MTERRLGYVCVPMEWVHDEPIFMDGLMDEFTPIDAEYHHDRHVVEYLGYHESFHPVSGGSVAPDYGCNVKIVSNGQGGYRYFDGFNQSGYWCGQEVV